MIRVSELTKLIKRRSRIDTKRAFFCRMLRFGIIATHLPLRELKAMSLRQNGYHYIVKNIQGSDMLLNPNDGGISTDLLLDGIREPLIGAKYRELLKEGMTVYDIGANIGYYALQEASLVGKSGHIYAIEPVSENSRILELNIALNRYENVEVYNKAIGECQRVGEINISPMSNMCSMVKREGYREYSGERLVEVDTVDNFMRGKRPPDVIRMDTEGYEVQIVQGMEQLLKSKKPLILFIEIHFDVLLDSVIPMLSTLKKYGFEIKAAAYEPHSATRHSIFYPLVNLCEKGMGASGYVDVKIDGLINKRCFTSGQVENMEVIFEREL